METSISSITRAKIFKTLPYIIKTGGEYVSIFKTLTSRNTVFQALLIVNEILFFHEITCLLKKCELGKTDVESTLLKFIQKLYLSLKLFIEYFRKGLTPAVMKSFCIPFSLFTLQILKHINIIEEMLDLKVNELASFEYLSLAKFTLDFHKTRLNCDVNETILKTIEPKKKSKNSANVNIYSNSQDSEFLNVLLRKEESQKLDITLVCFNYKCNYRYEAVNYTESSFVFNKMSEKFMFHLISTLVNYSGLYVKGPAHSGKKKTFQVGYYL